MIKDDDDIIYENILPKKKDSGEIQFTWHGAIAQKDGSVKIVKDICPIWAYNFPDDEKKQAESPK